MQLLDGKAISTIIKSEIKTEVENKANKIAESLDETDNLLNKLNLI